MKSNHGEEIFVLQNLLIAQIRQDISFIPEIGKCLVGKCLVGKCPKMNSNFHAKKKKKSENIWSENVRIGNCLNRKTSNRKIALGKWRSEIVVSENVRARYLLSLSLSYILKPDIYLAKDRSAGILKCSL